MTDQEFVDAYGNACLRAGQSNSGLCISPGASGDWEMMQKWREAVTRRLADVCRERDFLRDGLAKVEIERDRWRNDCEMGNGCLIMIAEMLTRLGCEHGPETHKATPPMFYPEWIACVFKKNHADLLAERDRLRVACQAANDLADNLLAGEKGTNAGSMRAAVAIMFRDTVRAKLEGKP